MKLQDIRYKETVPALGRYSPQAEAAVETAKVQTTALAIQGAAQIAGQLYKQAAAAEYTEKEGELRKDLTDLEVQLTSKSAFTPDEIPDYVDYEQTEQFVDENGNVDTRFRESIPAEEIRLPWYEGAVAELAEVYKDRTKNRAARTKLLQTLKSKLSPQGYDAIAMHNLEEMQANNLSTIEEGVDQAVASSDMASADQILIRGKVSGIISTSQYNTLREKAQQDVDRNAYQREIMEASSISELDNIYDDIVAGDSRVFADKPTRMTYEQRNHLLGLLEGQKNSIKVQRQETYDRTARTGVRRYLAGELSDEWLDRQLANNTLDDSTARALIGLRSSGAAQTENPATIARGKAYIKTMLFPETGETMSNTARRLRREFLEMASQGNINGQELDTLLTEVDQTQKIVTQNPDYSQAEDLIRSFVGIADVMITDNDSKGWAYTAFRDALYQYVDRNGAEADPIQFFHDHKDNFTPALFAESQARRFTTLYPRYEKYRREEVYNRPMELLDRDKIAADLLHRYNTGELSYDEVIFMWTELHGKPPAPGTIEVSR